MNTLWATRTQSLGGYFWPVRSKTKAAVIGSQGQPRHVRKQGFMPGFDVCGERWWNELKGSENKETRKQGGGRSLGMHGERTTKVDE